MPQTLNVEILEFNELIKYWIFKKDLKYPNRWFTLWKIVQIDKENLFTPFNLKIVKYN